MSVSLPEFVRRVLIVVAVVALALLVWRVHFVLLLVFGASLFAVMLDALARELGRLTHLPHTWALLATVIALLAVLAGVVWLFGTQIGTDFGALRRLISDGLGRLQGWLGAHPWGQALLDEVQSVNLAEAGGNVLSVVNSALWSLAGALANFLVIAFAGLFLAAQPQLYICGFVALFPPAHRPRVEEVLAAVGHALRMWLLGQIASMLIIGILTATGLWLIGIPSALALGAIAGLAEFVPVVGPIAAAVPGILIALTQGFDVALYVALFYIALQQIEGYMIMPVVQRVAVSLPPVVALFAVVTFGLILGPLGILFATPLAVVAMVVIRMLYVDDALGGAPEGLKDSSEEPSAGTGASAASTATGRHQDRRVPQGPT